MPKITTVVVNSPDNNFSSHRFINNNSTDNSEAYNSNSYNNLYNFTGNAKAHRANALIQHFYQRLQGYQTFAPFFNHYSNKLYSQRSYINKNSNQKQSDLLSFNQVQQSTRDNRVSVNYNTSSIDRERNLNRQHTSRATVSLLPEPWEMIDDLLDTTTARLLRHQADSSIFAMLSYASLGTTHLRSSNATSSSTSLPLLLPPIYAHKNNNNNNSNSSKLKQGERSSTNVSMNRYAVNNVITSQTQKQLEQEEYEQQREQLKLPTEQAANMMKSNNTSSQDGILLLETWKADHPQATAAELRRETSFWHRNAAERRWNKNRMALQQLRKETQELEMSLSTHNNQCVKELVNVNKVNKNSHSRKQRRILPQTPFATNSSSRTSSKVRTHHVQEQEYNNNNDNDDEEDEEENDDDNKLEEEQEEYVNANKNGQQEEEELSNVTCKQERAWNKFVKAEIDVSDDQVYIDSYHNNNNNNSNSNSSDNGVLHQWLKDSGWRHHSHREENAATIIQCTYRSYLARCKSNQARLHRLHALRELARAEEDFQEEWENAVQITIQLQGNLHYNINHNNNNNNNSSNNEVAISHEEIVAFNSSCNALEPASISVFTEANKDKLNVEPRLVPREQIEQFQRAVRLLRNKVHALVCKRRARKVQISEAQSELESYAATTIQRVYRGYCGRVEVKMTRNPALRQQRWERRVTYFALRIQTWWRCQSAQHQYKKLQVAVRKVQCAIRCWSARIKLYRRRATQIKLEKDAIKLYACERIAHFYHRYCCNRGACKEKNKEYVNDDISVSEQEEHEQEDFMEEMQELSQDVKESMEM